MVRCESWGLNVLLPVLRLDCHSWHERAIRGLQLLGRRCKLLRTLLLENHVLVGLSRLLNGHCWLLLLLQDEATLVVQGMLLLLRLDCCRLELSLCLRLWSLLDQRGRGSGAERSLRVEGAGPRCRCRTVRLLGLHNLSLLGLLLRCLLAESDHIASVLRDIDKLLLLLGYHLSVYLVMRVGMRVVDGNGLGREMLRRERCLTSLRLNTEGLRKGRLLHLLQVRWCVWRCSRIVLLLLELLLSKRQSTLELLHHVVALLLLIDELLVKDLIDARYRLFHLREHQLQLPLQLRHYLTRHCLLELVVNNFAHLGVCKLRSSGDGRHRRRERCG